METIESKLKEETSTWFLTGAAGFIGSNILEFLLRNNQRVVAIDNLSTGKIENIEKVKSSTTFSEENLSFHKEDICNLHEMTKLMKGCDYVIHQAALGSVPRSIKDPIATHFNNVDGTVNIFKAAVDNKIKRVVYASSSSVYGDHPELPKYEDKIGKVLSPYASSKKCCEVYAESFANVYDIELIGLRYFNVFGKRQDPDGPYAAVIPKWIQQVLENQQVVINGDGETSRDFTYIDNIVQLNILSAITTKIPEKSMIFNGAFGLRITLNELYTIITEQLNLKSLKPKYADFRAGDIRHSLASIENAQAVLDYAPQHSVKDGLKECIEWYVKDLSKEDLEINL